MRKDDICYSSACAIADLIKRQEIPAEEITEIFIERIERINPIVNAYCTLTLDIARDQAKKSDRAVKKGEKLGILNGVPASVKDLLLMKGVRTTFGSKIYENYVPDEDSVALQRIKDAGSVILGKTNAPEFGYKGVTDNRIFGSTRNPWNLERISGGSSGGAGAAVASGLGPLAIGSDGAGSIRIPSSFCGCYGLKPHFGRVPRYPTHGIEAASLAHVGPIVRYVKDAALMLDVMKGPHHADYFSLPTQNISYLQGIEEKPKKLKIGFSMTLGFSKALDHEVEKSVLNAVQNFEQFDWIVEESKIKMRNPETILASLSMPGIAHDLGSKLNKWRDQMDKNLVLMVEAGKRWKATEVENAKLKRKKLTEILYRYFKEYDLLITPTTALPAFDLKVQNPAQINEKKVSLLAWVSFTYPFNITGHPAASIPCGWTKDGLPIGLQIIGSRFDELTVLQTSKAFEEIAPWQDKRPKFD